MKRNDERTRRTAGWILAWLNAAALLLQAGCSSAPNEQDGQQEPTLAEYGVYVSPASFTMVFDPQAPSATQKIQLSVSCLGPNLPSDCDEHAPLWTVKKPANTAFLEVSVDDWSKPQTDATVTLNVAAYLAQFNGDPSSLGEHWYMVGFVPSSVPEGLKLTGNHDVMVYVKGNSKTGARQEQTPQKPRLSIAPNKPFLLIQGLIDKSTTKELILNYLGDPTQISDMSFSGEGAAQFSVIRPSTPFSLDGQGPTILLVQFQVAQEDLLRHQALLTVTLANGLHVPALLAGQRQDF